MTLREHLEAIRDAYPPMIGNHGRIAHEHAVAALAIMDKATTGYVGAGDIVRLVPDPEPTA